jgi:hypothetical protein
MDAMVLTAPGTPLQWPFGYFEVGSCNGAASVMV